MKNIFPDKFINIIYYKHYFKYTSQYNELKDNIL
ncbi:hypothetical protein ABID31_001464 [Chryseobacterium flavum]